MISEDERIRQNMIDLGKSAVDQLAEFCRNGEPEGMVPRVKRIDNYGEVIDYAQRTFSISDQHTGVKSQRDSDEYYLIDHFPSTDPDFDNVFVRRTTGKKNGKELPIKFEIVVVKRQYLPEYKKDWNIKQ